MDRPAPNVPNEVLHLRGVPDAGKGVAPRVLWVLHQRPSLSPRYGLYQLQRRKPQLIRLDNPRGLPGRQPGEAPEEPQSKAICSDSPGEAPEKKKQKSYSPPGRSGGANESVCWNS